VQAGASGLTHLSLDHRRKSVPVSDPVQKAAPPEPKQKMKTFGEQKNCALDRFKPYQRPKLSHAGSVAVNRAAELKPLPGVGCSEWLGFIS
jgi:hypothetical protein